MYRSDIKKNESTEKYKNRLNPSSNGCTVLTAILCKRSKTGKCLNPSSNGCTVLTILYKIYGFKI